MWCAMEGDSRSPGPAPPASDAMAGDLRRVRTALDRLSISYLLVRGDDDRPVIAVDRAARAEVEQRLRGRVRRRAVLRAGRSRRQAVGAAARPRPTSGRQRRRVPALPPPASRDSRGMAGRRSSRAVRVLVVRRTGDHRAATQRAHPQPHPAPRCRADERRARGRELAHPRGHVRRPRRRRRLRRRHRLLVGRWRARRPRPGARPRMAQSRVNHADDRPGTLPADRRTAVRPPQRARVRAVGSSDLHRHRLSRARLARPRSPAGAHRPQRGVLRRPGRAADVQLARHREPAPPHPGSGRALPLLERRHVLRPRRSRPRCSSRPAASRGSSKPPPASGSGSPTRNAQGTTTRCA